ncbi:hypothetical protein HHK36_005214 [Tetracentron sinense]|uniref:non-specific serine/threonine protein kinase n=1 Tax=Tetracentron sinense TaxID=13715 RepID=A0A835DML4_TETSI|nr:hypothetical protein HHK36_005214 [Tetracentron sinense]
MQADLATRKLFSGFLFCFLALNCFVRTGSGATPTLASNEVKFLKEIGKVLGKKDWNFSVDPCSVEGIWNIPDADKGFESYVTCDCSFHKNATCHVTSIDLSRNLLTGSVPSKWATMHLVELSIEGNLFLGSIPRELGNLVNIQKLVLSSNEFTGELPVALAKLRNLTDLRISDNNFSGKIPDFIRNWTQIEKLHIQGCSLEGPIPSGISALRRLSDLILRKCSIYGDIPRYIGEMTKLKNLYPSPSLHQEDKTQSCYFGIFLTTISHGKAQVHLNVLEGVYHFSLHINCGGKEIINNNGTKYEADVEARGASMFYLGQNWAFSSTGSFMDNDVDSDIYIETNTSALSNVSILNSELYRTARVTPLSLTYYGLCLINGNYTVKLHFAEIVYKNDSPLRSLGKRIFDVYIQGKLVLKDFNIEDEAGGPSKPIEKTFTAVVTSHTLKIHLYWAGKGTTGIPIRGVYGPLISAISVDPKFKPPSVGGKKNHVVIVVGVIASSIVLIFLVLGFLWRKGLLGGKISVDKDGTVIAVKQLSSKSKQGSREFVNEIGMISASQHPNLVKLYGCCAYVLQERGSLLELVDPNLGSEFSSEEAMVMLNVALLCTNASPTLRPTMSQVVSMLQGQTAVQDLLSDPGFSTVDSKFKAIRNHFWQNPSQTQSLSTNSPYTDSSSSNIDREETGPLVSVGSHSSIQ